MRRAALSVLLHVTLPTDVHRAEAEQVLVTEREELKAAKEELASTQEELDIKRAEAEELLRQLLAKGEEYDKMESELEDKLGNLEVEIGKMEVELDEAIYREQMATATVAPTIRPGSNAGIGVAGKPITDSNGIQWLMPCDYFRVASAFGWRVHPVYKDWRFHNGVDLAAWCLMKDDGTTDSPIIATRAGVVVISKYHSAAGWYVTIDHLDGYRSTYMQEVQGCQMVLLCSR